MSPNQSKIDQYATTTLQYNDRLNVREKLQHSLLCQLVMKAYNGQVKTYKHPLFSKAVLVGCDPADIPALQYAADKIVYEWEKFMSEKHVEFLERFNLFPQKDDNGYLLPG